MFKKIREFFRVLGELRYLIPLMRYEFPGPDDNASLAHSFEETVTKYGSNNFIYFENEKWTYNQTNEAANVLANKLIDDGIEHGDRVVLFMENRPNYINVFLELPVGTDIEETNNFAKIIEEEVNKSTSEYSSIIESVVTYVGQRTLNENDPSALGMRDTPNRARININFYEFERRNGINTIDVLEKLRNDINDYPGVSITYGKDRKGPPVGGEISIQVTGPDFQELNSQDENMRK